MRRASLALLLTLCACSAQIDLETAPIDQNIPITSVGEPVYVEIAVDLPSVTTGDLALDAAAGTLRVINPSSTLKMDAELRLSTTGSAEPNVPKFFTRANLPAYWTQAHPIFPLKTYAPRTTIAENLSGEALRKALEAALKSERLYIMVAATANPASLNPAVLPAEVQLEDIVVSLTATKPFHGIGGALDVTGL